MVPRASTLTPPHARLRAGTPPVHGTEGVPRRWRLRARLRGSALDRALAAGADPTCSRALAARAAQLTSRRNREQTASALDRLVHRAQGPQRRWWDLSQRQAILRNSSDLHGLAIVLTGERPLYAAGLAALNELLKDGTGPLYGGREGAVACALREVRTALEGSGRDDHEARRRGSCELRARLGI